MWRPHESLYHPHRYSGTRSSLSEFFTGDLSKYILYSEVRAIGAGNGFEDDLGKAAKVKCSSGHAQYVLFFIYKMFQFSFCLPYRAQK